MKFINTKGIYYLEQAGANSDWFWGEDYTNGDLYEAEELYRQNKSVKQNRLIMVHCPEGDIIEPIKLKDGQYLGRPSMFHNNEVYVVMADFFKQQLDLFSFDPDRILIGENVKVLDSLPISCIEDCYNLMFCGIEPVLTRQSSDQQFQMLWSTKEGRMNVAFQMKDHESFSHREGNKLYFTSWWEKEIPQYEYHEEVIIRNMQGDILDRFEGGIQELRPGEYYILQ